MGNGWSAAAGCAMGVERYNNWGGVLFSMSMPVNRDPKYLEEGLYGLLVT